MAAPRVCSVCRTTRLSRFDTGTVCAPCTRAARDLDGVTPTWLWDSQPMRQAENAVVACSESLDDPQLAPRNRACRHAQLAGILAESGDMASAISEGMAVLPELDGVTSVRALNELRPVRIAAGKAVAEEFCERFDAVERSLAAV